MLARIGLSHHKAPITIRERFNYPEHALPQAYASLSQMPLTETVLLSTCNRAELYVTADLEPRLLYQMLLEHMAHFHHMPEESFEGLLDFQTGEDAVRHLMRVAAGLDSLALGEAQILGQVRQALQMAGAAGSTGRVLHRLFEHALHTGKRVQTETGLGKGRYSVGHVAVEMAGRVFDQFDRARILILGAGKMSELTAKHLVERGVRFVVVANRTYARAVELAEHLGGSAMHWEEAMETGLQEADIVLSSTSAPHPVLHRANLQPVLRKRRGRPLFLFDIALPRDIDPDVNTLENVFLYNLDDLQQVVHADTQRRMAEIDRAEAIVGIETEEYLAWYRVQEVNPVIAQLRTHLNALRDEYLQIFEPRLTGLSPKERESVEALLSALIDQVARTPIKILKQSAAEDTAQMFDLPSAARALFELNSNLANTPPALLPEQETLQ